MAKRTSRSKTIDTGSTNTPTPPAEAPKARRGRATTAGQKPKGAAAKATRSGSTSSEPSEEAIRQRAYHRYMERGGGQGMEFDDWLNAEKELKARR
jgi:hypothetical protein